jgi:hypothetical protein
MQCYKNKLHSMLQEMHPQIEWQPWIFGEYAKNFLSSPRHHRQVNRVKLWIE